MRKQQKQVSDPQMSLDFTPLPTFLVGCRIEGEIQQYHVEASDALVARRYVEQGVEGAHPVLVRIK